MASPPARRDRETEWLDPIYDEAAPDDQTKVLMPTADLGYTPPRFRWRHILTQSTGVGGSWASPGSQNTLIGSGLVSWPGSSLDISYHKADGHIIFMVYEGEDPFNPTYIYIRQKVFLEVQTEVDSMGIGGIGINNSASIPKQKTITTSVINNKPTDVYERHPDINEPAEWAPDPENRVYKYTTHNNKNYTPYAEEGSFPDYDGDYSGGGGSFIMHWVSVWYDIEIPPSAKFYCPNNRIWDQWQVPTRLNPKRLQFQFEVGSSDIDGVQNEYPIRYLASQNSKGVTIAGGFANGAVIPQYFFKEHTDPSISYDDKQRIWVGAKATAGYFEYYSDDGCQTFGKVRKIWEKEYRNPKHIWVEGLGVRASIAHLGDLLLFNRSDLPNNILIRKLSKSEKYILLYQPSNGTFHVLNSAGQGFHSLDGGEVWLRPENTLADKGDTNSHKRQLMSKGVFMGPAGIHGYVFLDGKNLLFKRSDVSHFILIKALEKPEAFAISYHASQGTLIVTNQASQSFHSVDGGMTWLKPEGISTNEGT